MVKGNAHGTMYHILLKAWLSGGGGLHCGDLRWLAGEVDSDWGPRNSPT